jgi:hypothetical protein
VKRALLALALGAATAYAATWMLIMPPRPEPRPAVDGHPEYEAARRQLMRGTVDQTRALREIERELHELERRVYARIQQREQPFTHAAGGD